MPLRKHLGLLTIYLTCLLVAFCIAALHSVAQTGQVAVAAGPGGTAKPYFSLSTNRTYGTSDRARVWISYVGLTAEREAQEKSSAFKQGQRFRAGIEGRISVLFRGRG